VRWHGGPVDTFQQHLKIGLKIECAIVNKSKNVHDKNHGCS
jgi:hypothetical protein